MKQTIWTCDRCGTTHTYTAGVRRIIRDSQPSAFRDDSPLHRPRGWHELADEESVIDACLWCVTDDERTEIQHRESEIPF
jgi:hypothetical protein